MSGINTYLAVNESYRRRCALLSPLRRTGGQDVTGWPANPKLVWHLKSNLIRTCVHVDEAVMGLSVHADGDGEGDNPLLLYNKER